MEELVRDMREAADVILALPPYSRAIVSPAVQLAVMAQKAADELEKRRWISVEERLPEDATRNLVLRFDEVGNAMFHDILWYENGEWWNRLYAGDYAVTHWMSLPERPREESNGKQC